MHSLGTNRTTIAWMVGLKRGLLNTKVPLIVAFGTNVVNLGLDAVLINGLGPIPAYGIKGAAWATTIAEWSSAVTFLVLLRRENLLR